MCVCVFNLIKIFGWVQFRLFLIVVHHNSQNLLYLFVKFQLKCLPQRRSMHRYRCHHHQRHQKSLVVHSNRHFFRWHHVEHHKKFISKVAENVARNYFVSMVIRIRWGDPFYMYATSIDDWVRVWNIFKFKFIRLYSHKLLL